jgi:hypothetical protein
VFFYSFFDQLDEGKWDHFQSEKYGIALGLLLIFHVMTDSQGNGGFAAEKVNF